MDRAKLLRHLRALHFAAGDRDLAVADAGRIAAFLRRAGAQRVVGIGSAFDVQQPFTRRSDIDLVAWGLPANAFFAVSAKAAALTAFPLDLMPFESATPLLRQVAEERGVLL